MNFMLSVLIILVSIPTTAFGLGMACAGLVAGAGSTLLLGAAFGTVGIILFAFGIFTLMQTLERG